MIEQQFSSFPILITERLTLRQLTIDDQQPIFALRSDPVINKYLNRAPCNTKDDAINFIKAVNDNIEKSSSLYWAISLTETKTFVGTICLYDFSAENNICEIGFELMTAYQGKGLMKEAMEQVIEYAFNSLQFQKIVAYTHKDNQRSIKLLAGCKFVLGDHKENTNPNLRKFELTYLH